MCFHKTHIPVKHFYLSFMQIYQYLTVSFTSIDTRQPITYPGKAIGESNHENERSG